MKTAEESPYWSTTVSPARSQAEIQEMLEDFGVRNIWIVQANNGNQNALLIRFDWEGRSYRFAFTPLDCRSPERTYSFGGKRRAAPEQARYQMGRAAVWFVKAVLTAAACTPAALFGFLELPGVATDSGLPAISSELDVSDLVAALPDIPLRPASYLALASGGAE